MHSTYTGESERAYARQVAYTHAMECNLTGPTKHCKGLKHRKGRTGWAEFFYRFL